MNDRLGSVFIYTDGASRGNPGSAGIGVVIKDGDGNVLREVSQGIGIATNNVAEYTALICALEEAKSVPAGDVTVRCDSELLLRQLSGDYKVRSPALSKLYVRVKELLAEFDSITFEQIPRQQNREADRLATAGAKHRKPYKDTSDDHPNVYFVFRNE